MGYVPGMIMSFSW